MIQICTRCQRTAPDGNLWCQEVDCPNSNKPVIFSYGEPFGDIEIVKVIAVLPASAIYEAVRGDQPLLLKIAHDGYHDRLKREAEFLSRLREKKINHPMLPELIPAHRGYSHAYGKTSFEGRMKYYCLFEHSEGVQLREFLLKNHQPWYLHAGWIALGLADIIGLMHEEAKLHLAICPESIQVRFDDRDEIDVPRIKLLDLGVVSDPQDIAIHWRDHYVPTAYIAPELMAARPKANASSDVYGIGLALYEMFAGHPAFEYRLRDDSAIRMDIRHGRKQGLNRDDLDRLPTIAERATHVNPRQRFQNVTDFMDEMLLTLPALPEDKPERKWNRKTIMVLFIAAILIPMLLVLAIYTSTTPVY